MTVQEFLRGIPFNDVMEAVRKRKGNEGVTLFSYLYKEAYDILCNMPPRGKSEDVRFCVSYDESGNPNFWSEGLEDYSMEDIVGKEIKMPENNPFTDAELAVEIIWWATFLGFTPREQRRLLGRNYRMRTKYAIMAHQLRARRDLIYPYPKSVRKRIRRAIKNPNHMWKRDDEHEWYFAMIRCAIKGRRLNRAKRKREYRMEKRIEWLCKLDQRQLLIENIAGIVEKHDLDVAVLSDMIMNANAVMETWRESHTFGKSSRMDYIVDLSSNYYPNLGEDLINYCHMCLVIAYTAPGKTVSPQEEAALKALLDANFERTGRGYILLYGEDAQFGEEIALRFIGIKYFDSKN